MLFSSTIFLFLFLPVVLIGYYALHRWTNLQNYLLLAASLAFYAWGEPIYVFLMIFSIIANFLFGKAVDIAKSSNTKRIWLISSVFVNLGILFYFKYFNFAVNTVNSVFNSSLSVREISLPIGISFFTFQAMSYVIDVYRGTTAVQNNPFYLGLYISFFPQLIAGPIVRYNTIEAQINCRSVNLDKFQDGIFRFIQGFAKKIIIANNLSLVAEEVFGLAQEGNLSTTLAWLGALAYTFQIFFDFSGYSDMAIGLGKMFGFEFEENFNCPYISKSVSEFWNRWHISLGHWFRDYVYFPLGGSRVSKLKLVRNLFVVWLLTGIWHGAAWQFIIWGIAYGVIISIEKLTGFPRCLKSKPAIISYGILTFLIVNAGWVLFGAKNVSSALYQLGSMLGVCSKGFTEPYVIFVFKEYGFFYIIAAIFSTPIFKMLFKNVKKGVIYYICKAIVYLVLLFISVSYLVMGTNNPFIYFNF